MYMHSFLCVGILVKSISTALLVVGLITLLLGGSAVIIGIIVFKVIVKRYANNVFIS